MSHYADYMTETFGKRVIEDKHGFALYWQIPNTEICYIEDIYVAPDARKDGAHLFYEKYIINWAKEQGCKHMYGSVNMKTSVPELNMSRLLKAGYKLAYVEGNLIYFSKELI